MAISNERLVRCAAGRVTFHYRDSAAGNLIKETTVTAEEFIRRFLLHVLPDRLVRIRHYGLLSNRNRKTKLAHCQGLLGNGRCARRAEPPKLPWEELLSKLTGTDPMACPHCGKGRMRTTKTLLPLAQRAPPAGWRRSA